MIKIKSYILAHKIISTIALIVLLGGVFWGYKKFTSTADNIHYLTAKAEKGTIIVSVSGTGQVSALIQIDIKAKASGDVVYIPAQNGQKIVKGALIMEFDYIDAQKSVRDAELSLQSAKISLSKLEIQNSNENMETSSIKAYGDGFNTVSDAFYDLNSTLTGLDEMLDEDNLSENATLVSGNIARTKRKKAETVYYKVEDVFDQNVKNYEKLDNNSPKADIENIIEETYDTTKLLSDAIKNTSDFVDFMANDSNSPSEFTANQTTLSTYTETINGHLSSLLSAKTNINNNKDSIQNSALDIQNAQLSVQQKENALRDAKDELADYFIRAPFDGTLASISVKKYNSVTAGTTVATLITPTQLAEISLNEVDVAKIKIGQKTTLTFDAIPELSISGNVTNIDTIGAVSQGVVTYIVKIGFDTQNERVKSGMSVSTEIVTDMKEDVLAVPNSAIKSQTGASYIEIFRTHKAKPTKIRVETGLSNDTQTEIISGIKEGDEIITRTILPSAGTSSTAPSLFSSPATGGNRAR